MTEPKADIQGDAKAIFLAALECASVDAQSRFLDQACGSDTALRKRVDELLEANREAGAFLGGAENTDATRDALLTEHAGAVIGPYKLIEPIGEGGMGTVWMAQQTQPVKRLVALKLIKAGMDSKQVIARFEAERQALALMDHPNIAKVFDGGVVGQDSAPDRPISGQERNPDLRVGRPYFVMEMVKGVSITKYCDEHHLTPRQRLELFVPICHAVQHAHQKGIIHRDLKPSNVLVALYDGKPVPKVIDFGVAKAMGQPLTEQTLVTGFGNIVGTLEYMSPEQAEINQLDIDTRSDIYSLGVLLYELLTGSPPFSRKELENAGMLEMLRVIREQEPSKPSTKLSTAEGLPTLAANRGTEPAKLTQLVRGELDWIVMKALEKDRNRRYETANGFAMDVQRYLADEAVLACPPSVGYRFRKFARRNKAALTIGSVTALAVLIVAIVASLSAYWLNQEQQATHNQLVQTQQAEQREKRNFEEAKEHRQRAERLADENRRQLVKALVTHGVRLMDEGDAMGALPWFTEALSRDQDDPARALMHRTRIEMLLRQSPRLAQMWFPDARFAQLLIPDAFRGTAEFSPDGRFVVIGRQGQDALRVFNIATGESIGPKLLGSPFVHEACFSRDGRQVLFVGAGNVPIQVYDPLSGKLAFRLDHPNAIHAEYSRDGSRILTASYVQPQETRIWDASTGTLVARFTSLNRLTPNFGSNDSLLSPDGSRIVTVEQEPTGYAVRVKDVDSGKTVVQLSAADKGPPRHASFSPDGRLIVTLRHAHPPELWNAHTGAHVRTLGTRTFARALFSVSGTRLVTVSGDTSGAFMPSAFGAVRVWDATNGQPTSDTLEHPALVNSACFNPNCLFVATACADGKVRIFGIDGKLTGPVLHHGTSVRHIAFGPDGHQLLTVGEDSTVRVWEISPAPRFFATPLGDAPRGTGDLLAFGPDSRRIVVAGSGAPPARIWDLSAKRAIDLNHGAGVSHVSCSLDGKLALTVGLDGAARVWNASNGAVVAGPFKHQAPIVSGVFHPKGDSLVTTGKDGAACVWNIASGARLFPPLVHKSPEVRQAVFSADGTRLLTTAAETNRASYETCIWNGQTGERLMTLNRRNCTLSPDGTRLAATSQDGSSVEVFKIPNPKPALLPMRHSGRIRHIAFSADSRRIVAGSEDGTARVWDAHSGVALTAKLQHTDFVTSASFSPDGNRLATGRVWDATTGEPLSLAFARHNPTAAVALTQFAPLNFSPDGRLLATTWDLGSVQVWDIAPGERPVAELVRWAELLSASRRDPGGSLLALTQAELRDRWHTCRPKPLKVMLLSPAPNAILQNASSTPSRPTNWEFRWAEVPGATQYHFRSERGPNNVLGIQHRELFTPSFECRVFDIPEERRLDWRWKVRALVNGVWTDWSEERNFEVAPLDGERQGHQNRRTPGTIVVQV